MTERSQPGGRPLPGVAHLLRRRTTTSGHHHQDRHCQIQPDFLPGKLFTFTITIAISTSALLHCPTSYSPQQLMAGLWCASGTTVSAIPHCSTAEDSATLTERQDCSACPFLLNPVSYYVPPAWPEFFMPLMRPAPVTSPLHSSFINACTADCAGLCAGYPGQLAGQHRSVAGNSHYLTSRQGESVFGWLLKCLKIRQP